MRLLKTLTAVLCAAVFVSCNPQPPQGLTLADTWVDLQKWVDAAIKRGEQEILLPPGTFVLQRPLVLTADNVYSTFRLKGSGKRYNGYGPCNGTELVAMFDGPAIIVQGGRNTTIENLSIRGPLWDKLFSKPYPGQDIANWPGERKRFNPSCGIAIDVKGFMSENTRITDCEIGGFEVGIITNPAGGDGNGDFLTIHSTRVLCCTYAVSITHTQSRRVTIADCSFLTCHTVLTNMDHGQQLGEIDGWIRADFNQIARLYNLRQSYSGPVTFQSCYGELIGMLGTTPESGERTTSRTVFRDCHIHLTGPDSNTYLVDGGSVLLDGGMYLTKDIAVCKAFVETRGAKFRPAYYESKLEYSPGDREAINLTRGLLGKPHIGNAKFTDIETASYFPLPASSDYQIANPGPNKLLPYPYVWQKKDGSYKDEVCIPPLPVEPKPGNVLFDDVTYTAWVVQSVSGNTCSLRRVNNPGVTIPATGHFYLIHP